MCLCLASSILFGGEPTDPGLLTLERIYGGREFEQQEFSARWLPDGLGYTTLEKSPQGGRDVVRHDVASDQKTVLVPSSQLVSAPDSPPLAIDGYAFSEDMSRVLIYTNSQRVWRQKSRGDYWVLDRSSHELKQLGGDARPASLMFATFSPDGSAVAYVRERNIYVEDLRSGAIKCLTTADSPEIINGTFDWVYEEELDLRNGFRWSPDGSRIAFWQIDTEGVRKFPLVNSSAGIYPEVEWFAYPKTGQQNPSCRVGVVDVNCREITWIPVPGDPRDHYIARMDWAANSNELVLQQLNRLQNSNRVMLAVVGTGEVRTLLTETDDAWVDVHDEMKWLAGGEQFTWLSERDGWRHVYLVSRDGTMVRQLTSGPFDVVELLHVDEKRQCAYFIASPENPTQRYLYSVMLDGTDLRRVTPQQLPGTNHYGISPAGDAAIHSRSTFDSPGVTDLVSLPAHETVRRLANNKKLRKSVEKLKREPAEFLRVQIDEDVLLDGWCIRPPGFDPARKYPLLVYVYGEPAGQTVRDQWGGKDALWHLMLAQRGYIVMSFDNRGTAAPRGREWRKCVYRQVGSLGPRDQAEAVRKVIEERPYIDADRIGIWGWSGGGSSALHAIFKYPDLYQTAISIAPVPNQRYYDTIYQERYMGLPNDNVQGYTEGSSINYAHQLKGNLLLIHGTGDDNCHYQTTELLINELIRHNKPFSMMAYPNRTHAIREGKNTTRHLRELMTAYLLEHLPPGPAEAESADESP